MASSHVTKSFNMLKYTYGLVFIAAGIDKFMNFATIWPQYYHPILFRYMPAPTISLVSGCIEIGLGVLILFLATRLGAFLTAVWLLLIALSLIAMGTFYDVAVRDIVMAVGALALACLSREQ